jgi:hypothetical protein
MARYNDQGEFEGGTPLISFNNKTLSLIKESLIERRI